MHLWRPEGVFEFCGRLVWFDLSVGVIVWDEDPFCFIESKKEKALCLFISLPSGCRRGLFMWDLGGGFIQYLEVFDEGDHVLKVWRLKVMDCRKRDEL
ncbi:hypothetical protein BVRB_8g191430 [Beta vulgaris subsp. vulgaris]|nr:hypothetical protein BVRB_8g191430 [Beta vulgaris subsp. vulgaris]